MDYYLWNPYKQAVYCARKKWSVEHSRVEGKKVFMGVAQIMLDDLDLSNIVIGWYKLFGTSSLVNVPPGGGKDKKKESSV